MSEKDKPAERRTISVPADLDARMAKINGENWSAIACQAFEKRLNEIAEKGMDPDLQRAVLRMRNQQASVNNPGDPRFIEGKRIGDAWAKGAAKPDELRRLEARFESRLADEGYCWEAYLTGSERRPAQFVTEVALGRKLKISDLARFWRITEKGVPISPQFVYGFIAGAIDVWKRIKPVL